MDADTRLVIATLFAQTASALTFGLLLVAFRREYRQPHITAWARSWLAFAVYLAGTAIGGFVLGFLPSLHAARLAITGISQVAALLHIAWLFEGTFERCCGRRPFHGRGRTVVATTVLVGIALALAFTWDPSAGVTRFAVRLGGRSLLAGVALVGIGIALFRQPRSGTLGSTLMAAGALTYGTGQLHYFVLAVRLYATGSFPDYAAWLGGVDLIAQFVIGIGMIIWLLEDEQAVRRGAAADLEASETRHRRIVEGSSAALLEEDLSDLVDAVRAVPAATPAECRRWLTAHPEFVDECIGKIRVLGVNDAALRIYGATSTRELLDNLPRLFMPESIGMFIDELVAFWEGRTTFDAEVVSQTLQGERRVLFYGIRAPFPEEGFHYVLLSIVDVTALKAAEAALRESEERYRTLFDNAPVGIGVADPSGRLLAVNDTMLALGGYARGEALPPVHALYYDPAVRNALLAELQVAGTVRQREVQFRHKDGSPWEANLSLTRVTLDGQPCVLAIVEDISQRKRLEEALRQAQKMEAVGQLTGGIAHDFNNFLTAIQVNAELAADLVTTDPEEAVQALAAVRRTAERSAALVRNLLAFSRQEGLRLSPLALSPVVEETAAMLRRLLPESVHIATDVPDALRTAIVAGDRSAIEQMLVNLATNARDAMPGGGTLSMAVRERVLHAPLPVVSGHVAGGTWLTVTVTDTGPGMSQALADRAFEPFFTTKPQGSGSGLGLAMVFGLARQHGGGVALETGPGKGATFVLYFVRTDGTPHPESDEAEEAAGGRGETILVVEDELSIREATRRLLTRSGYRVLTAADGAEGLAVLTGSAIEIRLVLADVVMPTMGGGRLMEAVRARGLETPFVFMSGYTDRDAHRGDLDPSVPLLAKPWRVGDLLRLIRSRLDGGQAS